MADYSFSLSLSSLFDLVVSRSIDKSISCFDIHRERKETHVPSCKKYSKKIFHFLIKMSAFSIYFRLLENTQKSVELIREVAKYWYICLHNLLSTNKKKNKDAINKRNGGRKKNLTMADIVRKKRKEPFSFFIFFLARVLWPWTIFLTS